MLSLRLGAGERSSIDLHNAPNLILGKKISIMSTNRFQREREVLSRCGMSCRERNRTMRAEAGEEYSFPRRLVSFYPISPCTGVALQFQVALSGGLSRARPGIHLRAFHCPGPVAAKSEVPPSTVSGR